MIAVARTELPRLVKAGVGDRQSSMGKNVAVFGATGFLGHYVVEVLGRHGCNVVVATRGDDMSWRTLRQMADLGKMVPSYISLKDEDVVRRTVAGCDTVINLMSKYYETKHYLPHLINCSFEDVNVAGAELVARVAREEGVMHLVHVSAANASADSTSAYARTKAEGEVRVSQQFPGAAIVRPNTLYGEEDRFLNLYALAAKMLPMVPLIDGGRSVVSPVYVGDAALGIATIADNFTTAGQTFNLSGRHEYTQRQVLEFIMEQTGYPKDFVEVPLSAATLAGKALNLLPSPYFTHDTIKLMTEDVPKPSAADNEKGFADLGIDSICDFETKAIRYLFRYREGGHFAAYRDTQGIKAS